MSSLVEEHDQFAYHPKIHSNVPIEKRWAALEASVTPSISKLDDIALLVKSLTYGEMITLAAELHSCGEIGKDDLADILHKWSLAHGATRSATGLDPQGIAGDK